MPEHKILGGAAHLRAIEQQFQMSGFGVSSADADAVGQGLQANLMTFAAKRDASAHIHDFAAPAAKGMHRQQRVAAHVAPGQLSRVVSTWSQACCGRYRIPRGG
jgi:hypothetical protein